MESFVKLDEILRSISQDYALGYDSLKKEYWLNLGYNDFSGKTIEEVASKALKLWQKKEGE